MGAFETRLAAGYRAAANCPTCLGLGCNDCCHTGITSSVPGQEQLRNAQKLDTPERDVSQGCDTDDEPRAESFVSGTS